MKFMLKETFKVKDFISKEKIYKIYSRIIPHKGHIYQEQSGVKLVGGRLFVSLSVYSFISISLNYHKQQNSLSKMEQLKKFRYSLRKAFYKISSRYRTE